MNGPAKQDRGRFSARLADRLDQDGAAVRCQTDLDPGTGIEGNLLAQIGGQHDLPFRRKCHGGHGVFSEVIHDGWSLAP
jgi:hypothetical protein